MNNAPLQGAVTPSQFNSHLINTSMDITTLGAIGDGVFDNYTIIQNALQNYDIIYFPRGTYYCSHQIILDWKYKSDTRVLIGADPLTTTILFQDLVSTSGSGFGLFCLELSSLTMSGLTLKYKCVTTPQYTRQSDGTGNGREGILASLTRGTGYFENCKFIVQDTRSTIDNPLSCSCFRAKSQYGDITRIKFIYCEFRNETASTVGGCLFISNTDTTDHSITNVEVAGCEFYKNGNDEILSAWSGNNNVLSNIDIHDNIFNYTGSADNDVLFGFYRKDTTGLNDNIQFHNNVINATAGANIGRSNFMYFNYSKGLVCSNKFNVSTTFVGAKFFGVQPGSTVRFYDNECSVNSTEQFNLFSYRGGIFYCKNNSIKANVKALMIIENGGTTAIASSELFLKFNKLDCAISDTAAKQVYIQLWETGLVDISDNEFNFKASQTIAIAFILFLPTNPISHELRLKGNIFSGGFTLPGHSNSLKVLFIENNISPGGKFIIYPSATGYSKLIVKNNISTDFQCNWATVTLANLATMATNHLWTNNNKYADLSAITPS